MSDQKVALITAGGSGMGADAARKLAEDGFAVGILSSSGKGEALGAELGGFGVTGSNLDVADLASLVDTAKERYGRVDVVNNSAGHGPKATSRPLRCLNPTRCFRPRGGSGRAWLRFRSFMRINTRARIFG